MHHYPRNVWIGLGLTALFAGARFCSALTLAGELSPQQTRVITGTTIQAMLDIARARREIHDQSLSAAKKDLADARILFQVVRMELPTTTLTNRVAIAEEHLAFDIPQNVLPDLIPIGSELEFYDSVAPTAKARQHLDKARLHLQKGNRERAMAELNALKTAINLHEVDVPLSHTDLLISKAGDLIDSRKTSEADKTLAQAEKTLSGDVVAAINASPSPRKAE